MKKITHEIATMYLQEWETGRFVVEASTLGLPPGCFPERIETDLGNGHPFHRIALNESRALYRQALGCIVLSILNS